jgi:hypothetical protein
MAYKVNRIGTPHFFERKTPISTAAPAAWTGWTSNAADNIRNVVYADPTTYTQYGLIRGVVNTNENLGANEQLAFGQVFQCPEVVSGNAIALE